MLKAGWHCGGDPNTAGTVADCPTCQICNGTSCDVDPAQNGQRAGGPSGTMCCAGRNQVPLQAASYAALTDPSQCPSPQENPNGPLKPNSSDGCSSPLGNNPTDPTGLFAPDAAFGSVDSNNCTADATNCVINPPHPLACEYHDFCYRTCNDQKSSCDSNFLANMTQICLDLPTVEFVLVGQSCLNYAAIYYSAVALAGGSAFQGDQVLACKCCQ